VAQVNHLVDAQAKEVFSGGAGEHRKLPETGVHE